MRVTEFFLGFGRRLWSVQRGETEFGIKAIPAGGYCKISGMSPNEEMPAEVQSRAFFRAKTHQKLVVLGAGSFLHFVLGFLLLFVLFAGIGTSRVLPVVAEVVPCIPAAAQCAPSDPASPAMKVGIKPGDRVIGINGVRDLTWEQVTPILRSSAGKLVSLIIIRDSEEIIVDVTLATRTVDNEARGYLGIINEIGMVRENPVAALASSTAATGELLSGSLRALIGLPSQIPALFGQTFGGESRSGDGLVGIVGVARVTGETASSANLTLNEKLATFILIVASLNIFVGIFNLIPILPLDGGHIAIALYEGARRRIYLMRGKSDPGPVDVEKLTPITIAVLAALIFLTLLLLFADIFNPIRLNL